MKTSDWLLAITLGWIGIFLGVVVFFLLCNRGQITITNIKDLFGIIISCVSMLITAFFVIMAVNAYGHSEMIEQKAKQVRELSTSLTDKYNEVNQKIEQVRELSTSLTDKYNEVNQKIEQVSELSTSLTDKYNVVNQKIEQVSELSTSLTDKYNVVNQKIEQVSELSTSLTDKYNEVNQKIEQVSELSTSLTNKYNEVNQKIEQVSELSTSLTDKYNDIYERTNKQRDYILRVIKDQNIDYYREVLKNRDNVDEVYKSSCLLALGNGGDASDIKPIEEIANDTKESNIIRKIAQNALEKLRSKFPDE